MAIENERQIKRTISFDLDAESQHDGNDA